MAIKRCEGKRQGFKRGTFGLHKCGKKATTVVTTKVGFSETHYCCDDDQCFRSVTGGYPANSRPIQ